MLYNNAINIYLVVVTGSPFEYFIIKHNNVNNDSVAVSECWSLKFKIYIGISN